MDLRGRPLDRTAKINPNGQVALPSVRCIIFMPERIYDGKKSAERQLLNGCERGTL